MLVLILVRFKGFSPFLGVDLLVNVDLLNLLDQRLQRSLSGRRTLATRSVLAFKSGH